MDSNIAKEFNSYTNSSRNDGMYNEIRRYYEGCVKKDVSSVNLASDVVFSGPIATLLEGREAFEKGLYELLEISKSLSIKDILIDTDSAAVTSEITLASGDLLKISEFWRGEPTSNGARLTSLRLYMDPRPILKMMANG